MDMDHKDTVSQVTRVQLAICANIRVSQWTVETALQPTVPYLHCNCFPNSQSQVKTEAGSLKKKCYDKQNSDTYNRPVDYKMLSPAS